MTSRLHYIPSLLLVGLTLLAAGCNGESDYLAGRRPREASEPAPEKKGSSSRNPTDDMDPKNDDPPPEGTPTTPDPNDPKVQAFVKDVKPIFDRRCSECHHAGKDLDLTKWSPKATMQKALATTNMPPSPREKMTAEEVAIVKAYVDKL